MSFESQFFGVLIEDCWVLGWRTDGDTLIFDILASLWPGHPNYEAPKPNEWTCYKRSELVFHGVRKVSGLLPVHEVRQTVDPDGSVDYGSLDSIKVIPDGFSIIGDFGDVAVSATSVQLRVAEYT